MAKSTKPRPVGRPQEISLTPTQLKLMDEMAFNQCKHTTISNALGVNREHLKRNYLQRLNKKAAEGKVDLRRSQRKMSKTTPIMAILSFSFGELPALRIPDFRTTSPAPATALCLRNVRRFIRSFISYLLHIQPCSNIIFQKVLFFSRYTASI